MRPMCMNTWKATVSHIAKRGILNQQQLAWQKLSDLDKQNFIFLKGPQSFLRKGLWLWTEIWLQNLVSPCKWQFLGTTHRDLLALHFMVAFLEYLCSKPPPHSFTYSFGFLSLLMASRKGWIAVVYLAFVSLFGSEWHLSQVSTFKSKVI